MKAYEKEIKEVTAQIKLDEETNKELRKQNSKLEMRLKSESTSSFFRAHRVLLFHAFGDYQYIYVALYFVNHAVM